MKTTMIIFRSILLAVILIGSNNRVHADTPAAQTGWLLRTATTIGVDEVTADPADGTLVMVYKSDLGSYQRAYYYDNLAYQGWYNEGLQSTSLEIESGEQFIVEILGGADEYLSWPYAYVGGWNLTSPDAATVSGVVSVEWEASNVSSIAGNPPPNYTTSVKITGPAGGGYSKWLDVDDNSESAIWDSLGAPNGEYTITITFKDLPVEGAGYHPIATIEKQVTLDNSGLIALWTSVSELSAASIVGTSPDDGQFEVWSSGSLTYSVADNASWLSCSPASGSNAGEHDSITVVYDTVGLAAGSYTGVISVASAGAANSPREITVALEVAAKPTLSTSVTELSASAPEGTSPANAVFEVWASHYYLEFYISTNVSWLSCSPDWGTSAGGWSNTITVAYDTSGLAAGSYTGVISIAAWNAVNSPREIEVVLDIAGPILLQTSVTELSATATEGSFPANAQFEVWGSDSLSYSVSDDVAWLSCSPANGLSSGEHDPITVAYNTVGLAAGSYTGVISVVSAEAVNSPREVEVVLEVTALPTLSTSITDLNATTTAGSSPANALFEVWGSDSLSYSILDDAAWLSCTPANGSSSGEHDAITVSYNTASLAPGTHAATITVSSADASNSPREIAVTLVVAARPALSTSVTELNAAATEGSSPANATFEVWGSDSLNYLISDDAAWLSCTPTSGSSSGEHDTIAVAYSTASLAAGSYSATITVTSADASNSPREIDVTLNVLAKPTLSTSVAELNASAQAGSSPADATFDVWGSDSLSYSISDDAAWLSCTPASGTSSGEHDAITVAYNTASLAAGTHTASITITSAQASNSPREIDVALTISSLPTLSTSITELSASATEGGSPANAAFTVWGSGSLSYSISDDAAWLSCSPSSGSSSGEHDMITVIFDTATLAAGSHTATITVSSVDASNSLREIAVTLVVAARPTLSASVTELNASATAGTSPANTAFAVWGSDSLSYSISDDAAWLSCTPASGTSSGEHDAITVAYDTASLSTGSYTGQISIVSAEAANSPRTVEVILDIRNSQGGVAATQTAWLLRTVSAISLSELVSAPPDLSEVRVYYSESQYNEAYTYYEQGMDWYDAGFAPSSEVVIGAGEQFFLKMPGGTDEYLSWPYAYVGGWSLTAPDAAIVSGDVPIEWQAGHRSGNAPDYAARVTITKAGEPHHVEKYLGVVWETESIVWDSRTVTNGTYDITVSFAASPFEGGYLFAAEVARVTKQVVVDNSAAPKTISISVEGITRSAEEGNSPVDATFTVTGSEDLSFSVSDDAAWLSCSPTSGSTGADGEQVSVTFATTSLAAGSYSAAITVSSAGADNSPLTIPVSLTIEPAATVALYTSVSSISAAASAGSSPADRTFEVWGSESLNYSISDNVAWLSCTPTSGSSSGERDTIAVSYNTASLAEGSYSAEISVSSAEEANSPVVIPVSLTIVSGATVTQTAWLLRTASDVNVTEIMESPPIGTKVYVANGGTYDISEYRQVIFQGEVWSRSLTIEAGQQFVFEMPGGTDEYLSWPYAHVGGWSLSEPTAATVSGDVSIAWAAAHRSGNAPDYAARVMISDDHGYEEDLGVIWESESMIWDSGVAPDGAYTITITIADSPVAGGFGGQVATITKEVVVRNTLPNPIEGGATVVVDGFTWKIAPADLVIGASSTGNALVVRNGGVVEAASVTVHAGSSLQLLEGGELIVAGDFDAGQGGFDFAAGGLAVGGSVSGISSLPAGNRLEALEIEGDLTVYGVFSPSRAEMIPLVLGEDVLMAAAASAPGAIVTGSLALEPGGALEMEIGGYTVGTEFDHLTVTDAATLGGELSIVLTDGFIPLVGHSFELFNFAGGVNGAFSAVNLLGPLGLTVDTSSLYSNGEISFELSESDSDADGIVDGWEFRYFKGDVWPTNNADGDSLNTLEEYIAGTDPTNASSYFRSEVADKVPEGFLVEWSPSVSNRIYSVLWTNELSGGFSPMETNIAFPRNSYTDTTHAAESAGFYLIDVRMRE